MARPPRIYVTQQQVTDARHETLAARRDIDVEIHGSLVLLRPQSTRARQWLAEHVGGPERYHVLPSRAANLVADAREAGLTVLQP